MTTTSLFRSSEFAGKPLKNRIVLAPLTRGRAGDSRVPNDLMVEYYRQRAGAGLLITEATVVSSQGNGWVGSPGIYTQEMTEGWRKVTDAVHSEGSQVVLQLWHTGRASHSDFHGGKLPVSASPVKIEGDSIHTPLGKKDYEVPHPLTTEEIRDVVADYKQAALNAKAAGFDGIEVHGANGYLINQFLDGRSNQRDDEYGGSIENRFRFFREVLDAVLEVWEADAVGVRISPNGVFNDMGADDYRDTFLYAMAQFESLGLGYVHVMDGLAFGFHERGEPMTLAEFRPLYSGLLMGNCGYTPEQGGARIEAGEADLIAYGRPFITNPDLPERIQNSWPLNDFSDSSHWYGGGAEGYTDFPAYQPE